jgi:hypothetical protein
MTDVLDRPIRELFLEASHRTSRTGVAQRGSASRQSRKGAEAEMEIFGAAFALLVREAVPVMEKMGTPLLAAALREERPGAAVAGLLADFATESLVAEANSDPLAVAIAATARRRRELLAEAGGGLSTAMVARALGTSRQAVDKRRRTGTLLAVPMPAGDWAFPAAQFGADQRPLEGLANALRAFTIDDPWMRLAELLAPDADLGDRSALQVLRAEGRAALPQVCRALASVGEHGA